jgi:hypothetical protein
MNLALWGGDANTDTYGIDGLLDMIVWEQPGRAMAHISHLLDKSIKQGRDMRPQIALGRGN